MTFREGLLQVYKNRRTDGEVTDPFYLYCRLSDACSSTYEGKRKVELFYAIDRRLCIFETLIKEGEKGEETLLNSYLVVSELLSQESFEKLIQCAVWVMSPAAKLPTVQGNAVAQPPKNVATPMPPPPKEVVPVKVERSAESVQDVTRTPLTSSSYGASDDVDAFIGMAAILVLLTLAVGVFGLLAWIFRWHISWTVWQWLIGVVGGGWLTLIVGFFVYILNDAYVCEYCILGFLATLIGGLLNTILFLLLKDGYRVLYGCFGGWIILWGIVVGWICYEDVEEEWCVANLVASAAVLLAMIACLIWV